MDWPPGPRPIPSPVELGLVFVVAESTKIGQDNPDAADHLLDDIEAACSRLAKHPRLGVARPEIGNECRLFFENPKYPAL